MAVSLERRAVHEDVTSSTHWNASWTSGNGSCYVCCPVSPLKQPIRQLAQKLKATQARKTPAHNAQCQNEEDIV